ncbi:MAG: GNAT family N-acetyltransferase [Candidatus Acidiferrales bacterium]
MIVVRRAELSDADSLAETAARAFPLGCPKGTPQSDLDRFIQTELTAERFASHIANRANELSVAMAGERMAGFSMLCKESPLPAAGARVIQCKNPLELRKIYVLPEFHGCGAGDALMRAAIARAKEVKAGCIWLSVSKFNERGLAFYRKHEFKVAGNATFLVGSDLQEDFLMVRQARASALPRK